jgi:hypothetical protein
MWYAAKLLIRLPAVVSAVCERRSTQLTFKQHARTRRKYGGKCNEMYFHGAD